jgi:hypothetical protein
MKKWSTITIACKAHRTWRVLFVAFQYALSLFCLLDNSFPQPSKKLTAKRLANSNININTMEGDI